MVSLETKIVKGIKDKSQGSFKSLLERRERDHLPLGD